MAGAIPWLANHKALEKPILLPASLPSVTAVKLRRKANQYNDASAINIM